MFARALYDLRWVDVSLWIKKNLHPLDYISSIFGSTDTPRDCLDLGEERWRESVPITSL